MLIKLPNGPFVNPSEVTSVDKNESDYCVVMVATVDGKVHRSYVPYGTSGNPDQLKAAQQKLLDEIVNLINGPRPIKQAEPSISERLADLRMQVEECHRQNEALRKLIESHRSSGVFAPVGRAVLKGGQGTTPPEDEARPAAPPSPPMKAGFDLRAWIERRKSSSNSEQTRELREEVVAALESGRLDPMSVSVTDLQKWCDGFNGTPFNETVELLLEFIEKRDSVKPKASKFSRPVDQCDLLRGTGRTTAGMLKAIAHALECPGEWVPFIDHGSPLVYHAGRRAEQLKFMCTDLKLDMSVEHVQDTCVVRVKSNVDRNDIGLR